MKLPFVCYRKDSARRLPSGRRGPLSSSGTTLVLASAALLLAGCASLAPDGGAADIRALVGDNPLTGGAPLQRAPDPRAAQAVDALLAKPLDAEAAVRVALAASPRVQDAFATLQLSDAERVQAASLPNPVFAFGRLKEGGGLEIDRALRFSVLGLLSLPWQARWAGQRHEVAKLEAAQRVLQLAADTRRAWVRAVAARQSVAYLRDAKDAAEAGAELARRMAQAGNWSALQRTREQLLLADAAAQLARAEQAAVARREQLTRLLGLTGTQANYVLAERLPPLPAAALEAGDVQARALRERLDLRSAQAHSDAAADALGLVRASGPVDAIELGGVRNSLPGGGTERGFELELPIPLFDWGQARRARAEASYLQAAARVREIGVLAASEAREALDGWRAAHAVARRYQDEVLPLRRQVNDETLLRYNGMLASVWELLGEARTTMLAVTAAIDAQRDFWLADTDLQLALTGSSPAGLTTLAGAAP